MSDPSQEEIKKVVGEIFFPYASRRLDRLRADGTKFVHYTSAENAIRIIDGNCVHLRNTNVMNDFSEVQHGNGCIMGAFNDKDISSRLAGVLDGIEAGLMDKVRGRYLGGERMRSFDTFMLAISEHGNNDSREDLYGRLSMWRAYGGNTNVAFVFNNTPFQVESDALQAFTSPVLYADQETFKPHFLEVVSGLERHRALLPSIGAEAIAFYLVSTLHIAALSTKHPGFWEEKEWRVIFSPDFSLSGKKSDKMKSEVLTISGVPQRVYKLELKNYPNEGFVGATLPELLEEVIIGPTQYPWPIWDALVQKLTDAGVADAGKKVRVSNIPLRR